MDIIDKLLSEPKITKKYEAIDKINETTLSHGMKHITNVLRLINSKLVTVFNFTQRQREMLCACAILHDLGQTESRSDHWLRSAEFAREYLPTLNYFSNQELEEICQAIETHDEYKDFSKLKSDLAWHINFIDKMDFAKDRIDDKNPQNKNNYCIYDDIENVNFLAHGGNFVVKINTVPIPLVINEQTLFARPFFNKIVVVCQNYARHFDLNLVFKLNETALNLGNLSRDIILT